MKAYSQDVREKVLRAVDQGKARRAIVSLFGVSPIDAQMLSQATTRDGKHPPQADSRATVQEMRSPGGRDRFPTEGTRRCHLRRALSAMGGEHGDAGKYKLDESCHRPTGLDAQKKHWVPVNATKLPVPPGVSKRAS
jgi:hypothetical protein